MATQGIQDIGPTWLGTAWKQRVPVTIDAATGASTGTVDIEISVPDEDDFWNNVEATGYDIVPTDADGINVLSFALSGFDADARTCTVQIDAFALDTGSKQHMIWLYWNNSGAGDLSSAVTITSAIAGYIQFGVPRNAIIIPARDFEVGSTEPPTIRVKAPNATADYYWDITDVLLPREFRHNDGLGYEGVTYATSTISATGTGATSDAATRFVQANGRIYVKVRVTAGTSGTDETLILTVKTELGRILEFRATLDVQTVAAP